MKQEVVYCPSCRHGVRIGVEEGHLDGHANLPEGGQLVCLDFGGACGEGTCPLSGRPGVVMGVRLAKSHLNDEAFQVVHGPCASCGALVGLEMLDDSRAICPECDSVNEYVFIDFEDGGGFALTGI
jgi:hypothetical protein